MNISFGLHSRAYIIHITLDKLLYFLVCFLICIRNYLLHRAFVRFSDINVYRNSDICICILYIHTYTKSLLLT